MICLRWKNGREISMMSFYNFQFFPRCRKKTSSILSRAKESSNVLSVFFSRWKTSKVNTFVSFTKTVSFLDLQVFEKQTMKSEEKSVVQVVAERLLPKQCSALYVEDCVNKEPTTPSDSKLTSQKEAITYKGKDHLHSFSRGIRRPVPSGRPIRNGKGWFPPKLPGLQGPCPQMCLHNHHTVVAWELLPEISPGPKHRWHCWWRKTGLLFMSES